MNYKKVNDYFYKLLKKGNRVHIFYDINQILLSDGIITIYLPEDELLINKDKLMKHDIRTIDNIRLRQFNEVHVQIAFDDNKKIINKILEEQNYYVSDFYLKQFNYDKLMLSEDKRILAIYQSDVLLGFICTIKEY